MVDGYPSDWDTLRQKTYKKDNYTCQNCGSLGGRQGNAEIHAHHIVPKSKGGEHDLSNLTTLCKDCHNAVHGGESVQKEPVSRSQGVDEILRFPELAQVTEQANGSAFIKKAAICISEASSWLVEFIMGLINKSPPMLDLAEFIKNTIDTDSVEYNISRDNDGFAWIILDCDNHMDLYEAVHALATKISDENQPHRLVAVLFPFNVYFGKPDVFYWVYSQPNGSFYPFAPISSENNDRDQAMEFLAKDVAEETVYIEPDEQEWYPMWSSQRGAYPWELPIQKEILVN